MPPSCLLEYLWNDNVPITVYCISPSPFLNDHIGGDYNYFFLLLVLLHLCSFALSALSLQTEPCPVRHCLVVRHVFPVYCSPEIPPLSGLTPSWHFPPRCTTFSRHFMKNTTHLLLILHGHCTTYVRVSVCREDTNRSLYVCVWFVCIMTTGGQLLQQLINAVFIWDIVSCERSEPFKNTSNFSKINSYAVENNPLEC